MTKRQPAEASALPRLYGPSEIATAIGCSEWWVKEQARRRRIPYTRLGGSYRFTADHLDEIIRLFEERPERTTRQRAAAVRRYKGAPQGVQFPESALRLRARPPRPALASE